MSQDNNSEKLTLTRIFSKWYTWGTPGIAIEGLLDFSSGAGFIVGIVCWWLFQKISKNNSNNHVTRK